MTDDEATAVPKVHTRSLAEVGSGNVVLVIDPRLPEKLVLALAIFINDRGKILGTGVLPNGDQCAALLIPCDEDGSNSEGCQEAAAKTVDEIHGASTPESE